MNFFRSLILTTVFSFIAPIFLFGGILFFLSLFSYIPCLQGMIADTSVQVIHILYTFGSGSSLNGLLIISLTCGFVGALFDTYVYYRSQILRTDS